MSSKNFGCFFCDGYSPNPKDNCPSCGRPIDISNYFNDISIGDFYITNVLGRGFYGWTLLGENEIGQQVAIKVESNLGVGKKHRDLREPKALVRCYGGGHPNIARFVTPIITNIIVDSIECPVTCLAFDYISNATSLRMFVQQYYNSINRNDLFDILIGIISGLQRMNSVNIWHNDLHDDNIMIRIVSPDEGGTARYQPVLIDFGSAKSLSSSVEGEPERGDYYYLGKHINLLTSVFEDNLDSTSPSNRAVCSALRNLAHRLLEINTTRSETSPEVIINEIRGIFTSGGVDKLRPSFQEMLKEDHISFRGPFDNTNALTMQPYDINRLFCDTLHWQEQLPKSETVVITGPRGCGKTMLLRYLSIVSKARPLKRSGESVHELVANRLTTIPYIGFLVSCCDIRGAFDRNAFKLMFSQSPGLANDFAKEYLNAHFCLEILKSLHWLRVEIFNNTNESDFSSVIQMIQESLKEASDDSHSLSPVSSEICIERLTRRVSHLSNLIDPNAYKQTKLSRDDVLEKLTIAIKQIPWCDNKDVYFLLDDYSVTVLPKYVQESMNMILFRPSDEVRIKMTSEADGPILLDSMNRKLMLGREYTKINLGEIYFKRDEEWSIKFIADIIDLRCQETGVSSLAQIKAALGSHPHTTGFAKYIVEKARPGDAQWYGFELLCRLCSGDISYIIELLRSVLGSRWSDLSEIPPSEQDKLVKNYCQHQLEAIRYVAKFGPQLYKIAINIGDYIKAYLLHSKTTKDPDARLRIEIEDEEELTDNAKLIHTLLLKHSVLIEGGSGKSRAGRPTRRFFFRRLYAPCFPFVPTRTGTIAITGKEYSRWLEHPDSIPRIPVREISTEPTLFDPGEI